MVAVVSTREMPHVDTEADGQGQDGTGPPDGSAPARSDRTMRARIRSAPTGPGRWTAIAFLTTGVVIVAAAALAFWRRAIEELHRPEEGMSIILAPHNEATCSAELFSGAAAIMAWHHYNTEVL